MPTPTHSLATSANRVWPENPTLALRRPLRVSGGCATRRYVVGRIQLGFGVHNLTIHFGSPGSIRRGRRLCARSSLRHRLANSYRGHNQRGTGPRLDRSGSGPVIVVQHAAQALPTSDLSRASEVAGFRTDELVSQSLMITLAVIMSNEVLNDFPQMTPRRRRSCDSG